LGDVVISAGILLAVYAVACSDAVGSCIVAVRKWELDGAQRAIERRQQREQRRDDHAAGRTRQNEQPRPWWQVLGVSEILILAYIALLIAVAVSTGYIWWFVLFGIVYAIIWLSITIARWLGSPTILALDAAHAARDRLERERATRAGAGASAPREHGARAA